MLRWRRQRQEKYRRWPTLNLVALMDVFTILVFFFLVHSTESPPGDVHELVELPESLAAQPMRETPVVTITQDQILLEERPVVPLPLPSEAESEGLEMLRIALQELRPEHDREHTAPADVTIRGDRRIPFDVLNRVMRTCSTAGFGNISLAVLQLTQGTGQP